MGCTVNGLLSIYIRFTKAGDSSEEAGRIHRKKTAVNSLQRLQSSLSPVIFFGARDCLPPPSVSKLSLTLCSYLSMVTRSSSQSSVDDFRRERLQRLATFDSFSVTIRLEARSRMESTTTVLPRRNLEAIGAVGANLRPFSFSGSVGPLRWSLQPS